VLRKDVIRDPAIQGGEYEKEDSQNVRMFDKPVSQHVGSFFPLRRARSPVDSNTMRPHSARERCQTWPLVSVLSFIARVRPLRLGTFLPLRQEP